jgi:NAD(P)-dependent dehydrogenase (short-subunit alcohol dehydrogenase family)
VSTDRDDRPYAGRVAVVSGAARSFGRLVSEALAEGGATVAAVDLSDCGATTAAIEAAGGRCTPFAVDVADERSVARLAVDVAATLGPCDILVNIAGINFSTPWPELDLEAWRRVMAVNLESQFLMAQAFAPQMVARGWGRIVNMASSSIYTNTPGLTAYMASKAGVLGLTSGLANDLGQHGITVNAVSPGLTRTEAVEQSIRDGEFPEAELLTMANQRAIRRDATAGDLVGTILFLASEAAAFVTARFIVADGGATRTF